MAKRKKMRTKTMRVDYGEWIRQEIDDALSGVLGTPSKTMMQRAKNLAAAASTSTPTAFLGTSATAATKYGGLTKNLAAKILRMGPNVPPEIAQMADDAARGVGGHRDADLLKSFRGYLGIERSGASWINRKTAAFRRGIAVANKTALQIDLAERGGMTGAVAQAELVQNAAGLMEKAVTSKPVMDVLTKAVSKLGMDPSWVTKNLFAIGRGLRLGGIIGAGVQAGFSFLEERETQRRAAEQSKLTMFAAAAAVGMDPALTRQLRQNAESWSGGTAGYKGNAMDALGLVEESHRRTQERFTARVEGISAMRGGTGDFGVSATRAIAEYAAARGVPIGLLTPFERRAAVDAALATKYEGMVDASQITAQLEQRGIFRPQNPTLAAAGQYGFGQGYVTQINEAATHRYEREYEKMSASMRDKVIKEKLNATATAAAAAQRALSDLPAAERIRRDREQREASIDFDRFRRRHRAVYED